MAEQAPTAVIQPQSGWPAPDLRAVWSYRDLLYLLARRDIAVRYKQTAIGAAWAVLQPVAFAAVYSVFLSLIGKVPTGGIPFPVFALTGMGLYLFLAACLTQTAGSTVSSSALISKVYFPRLVIPLAAIVPPLVDLFVALIVLLVAMALFGVAPSANIVFLPAVLLLAVFTALGAGLWLSAIAVRFRDVQLLVPFVVQLGLFLSPVLYPLSLIPEQYRWLYGLNPVVGVMEAMRWSVLGSEWPGTLILVPIAVSVILFFSGLYYFTRAESRFADVI